MTDLGSAGSLSENLTANQKFSLQVKPALGSTITIQRTLPPAIGPVMDLDLMTSFGGGSSGGGGGGMSGITCTRVQADYSSSDSYVLYLFFYIKNNGTTPVSINWSDLIIDVNGGAPKIPWWGINGQSRVYPVQIAAGDTADIILDLRAAPTVTLLPGDTFTSTVEPFSGPALSITKTIPLTLNNGLNDLP